MLSSAVQADAAIGDSIRGATGGRWKRGLATYRWVRFATYGFVGGSIGALAWGGIDLPILPLLVLLGLPLAWSYAASRGAAITLMAAYFLGASMGAISGIPTFFGRPGEPWTAMASWVGFATVSTLPFAFLWTKRMPVRPWSFIAAICVLSLPPLGAIGMLNPLLVAGGLFPWLGWWGLCLTFLFMLVVGYRNLRWILVLAWLSMASNAMALIKTPGPPTGWQGINTRFSGLASAGADDAAQILASLRRIEWLTQYVQRLPRRSVTVLPETLLGSANGLTKALLSEAEHSLRSRDALVLVGAELPQPDGRYQNGVIVLGLPAGQERSATQQIPVPFAMWKPWARVGAIADPWARRDLLMVNGVNAAVLICYEQFLSYALLSAMLEQPKVLVAVSNIWWAQGSTIGMIQRQSVDVVARLFGIASIRSQNE